MDARISQVKIAFDETDFSALLEMSRTDCRPVREQVRFLVREEAKRRGLLKPEAQPLPEVQSA
jgi:hypothetical protein